MLTELFPHYNINIFINTIYYSVKNSKGYAYIFNETEVPVLVVLS